MKTGDRSADPLPSNTGEAVRHERQVMAVCLTAIFVVSIDGLMVPVIFPAIHEAFPATPETTLSWMVSGYAIVMASLVVTSGRVGDRMGRKPVYFAGLIAWIVGAAGSAFAPTAGVLIAARLLQGAGQALLMPASVGLLLLAVPPERHPRALAAWIGAGTIGGAVGPAFGALMVAGPGWRAGFGLSAAFCLAVLIPARRVLSDTPRRQDATMPDPVGSVALGLMLAAVVMAILKVRVWGLGDVRIIIALVVAATLFPFFWHRARTHPTPALDLDLFRRTTYRRIAVLAGCVSMALFTNIYLLTQFMTDIWHYSVTETALGLVILPVAAGLATVWAPRGAAWLGRRRLLITGLAMSVIGWMWLAVFLRDDPQLLVVFAPALVFVGIGGWGLLLTLMNTFAMEDLSDADYSTGTAVLATLRHVFGILGTAVAFGFVTGENDLGRYRSAFAVLALIGCLCIGIGARLPADPRRRVRSS